MCIDLWCTLTGPDWCNGSQDGGAGSRGTVDRVDLHEDRAPIAWVRWANGHRNCYVFRLRDELQLVTSAGGLPAPPKTLAITAASGTPGDSGAAGIAAITTAVAAAAAKQSLPDGITRADIDSFTSVTGCTDAVALRILKGTKKRGLVPLVDHAISHFFEHGPGGENADDDDDDDDESSVHPSSVPRAADGSVSVGDMVVRSALWGGENEDGGMVVYNRCL